MFRFFRTKLFILALLLAVGATFYYFGDPQKVLSWIMPKFTTSKVAAPISESITALDTKKVTQQIQESLQTTETELTGLTQKTLEVTKHTGTILGTSVEPASEESTTPLHEKALEYGKYIYCKEVVESYETLNPNMKSE